MPSESVMSGTAERAIANTPAVVATIIPAASPAPAPNNRCAIQHVTATRPRAPRNEGTTAVRCDTAPVGHAPSAISHA